MDSYTEVEHTGWFSRITDSIKSVGIGILLFALSIVVLWWNEGRAVQTAKSLDEGQNAVVPVAADKVDAANDKKLVHVSGMATTTDTLASPDFGIQRVGIRLVRQVEMYQWVEKQQTKTKKKLGGGTKKVTKYRYERAWSDKHQPSNDFKKPTGHRNPPMKYKSSFRVAQNVKLGAFTLPKTLIEEIKGAQPIELEQRDLAKLTPTLKGKTKIVNGSFYVRPTASAAAFEPTSPEVGDHRVTFSLVKAQVVSVVSQQVGSSFEPFPTKAGDPLHMLKAGKHSATAMFTAAKAANSTLTWVLRFVGWLLMVIGIGLFFRPLVVIADVIPFFGSLLGAGVFVISIALASPISLLVVAIAWFAARPLLGAVLLVLAVGLSAAAIVYARKRKQARAHVPAVAAAPAGAAGYPSQAPWGQQQGAPPQQYGGQNQPPAGGNGPQGPFGG